MGVEVSFISGEQRAAKDGNDRLALWQNEKAGEQTNSVEGAKGY